jgi:ADP-dependent NAD(P)H-hydrate dehydratase / NAD(P)H-hydrate epimerase
MSGPILTIRQMRAREQASWAAGCTETEVIRRVGETAARRALALTQAGDFILLLAGKGHNGDDVRAMQPHLPGRRVELLEILEPAAGLETLPAALARRPALVVDGLFGIGLDRPLEEPWQKIIGLINGTNRPVLAVDVPSGLNADTGEPQPVAVRADVTLAVGAVKRGLLNPAAWESAGRLEVARDVGLLPPPAPGDLHWSGAEDFREYPPRRAAVSHKGNYGHLSIVAGSLGFHGAAVLAARGAHRAQPGLVTLFTLEQVYHAVAGQLQSTMVSVWRPDMKFPANTSAVLVGPGLAIPDLPDAVRSTLRRAWMETPGPVVVDASALDWLPLYPIPQNAVRVITPHPGEAARLLKIRPAEVQANRVDTVREISRRYGSCWVVLKGHQTLIGRATGDIFVNSSGNPQLAQGGSGDVLAGYLAGLLAQRELQADPLRTIRYAVWQHGAAADRLARERKNWVIEDLAQAIGGI